MINNRQFNIAILLMIDRFAILLITCIVGGDIGPLSAKKKMHLKMSCHLLKLSAACKCLLQELISTYIQTVWTQIRLLLEEQSDLVPHCLLQRCFKWTSRRCSKRYLAVISSPRVSVFVCLI